MGPIILTMDALVAGRGGEPLSPPLHLALRSGEALAVTGPNGAGKSTLLRTIAGLLRPLAGRLAVDGALAPDGEPARHPREIAHYLGHRNGLRQNATLGRELAFWARHLGADASAVEPALEAVGLPGLASLSVGHLSAGQQRRAALARLMLAERALWLLDEPTAALDSASQGLFAAMARLHLASGGMIVAATHQPLGVEARSLVLARVGAAE